MTMHHNYVTMSVRDVAKAKSFFAPVGFVAALAGLVSCTTSFDMSGEHMTPLGPEWGVVIGSVLVQPERVVSGKDATGRDVSGSSYEFDIVQIQPGDPNGEDPYAKRYRLEAKAGEERMFIARLRSGQYLIKRFDEEGLTGLGGELELVFSSMAGEDAHPVHHGAGAEEEAGLEEGVRHEVEDARPPGADPDADEHEAELRDGRVGEDLLDVRLNEGDERREDRGERA